MEYDALARLIKEHPPRSDTADKLKHLNQELNTLKVFILIIYCCNLHSDFALFKS